MKNHLLKKIFSHEVKLFPNVATCKLTIFGIKITYKVKDPLFNAKICNKAGVKTLLIIREDGIGDFLFTRPYIEQVRNSAKYRDYKIIVAGTSQMLELAKKYDSQFIDEYILIQNSNKDEKECCLEKIKNMSFNIIINSVDAKMNKFLEEIVEKITADEKIGHWGYFSRYDDKYNKSKIKYVLDKYTRVIDTGAAILHVRERERRFFEEVLEEHLPQPQYLRDLSDIDLKSDFVVLSPFSRARQRTYSAENFVEIMNFVTEKMGIPVVIVGSKQEYDKAQKMALMCINPEMIYNMAGKLTLRESMLYIRAAKLLIANETGTVHIAQNFGVKTVCISNGSYMNTFQPYPKGESFVSYVYPDDVQKYLQGEDAMGHIMMNDINEIKPEKVIDCIKDTLYSKTCV